MNDSLWFSWKIISNIYLFFRYSCQEIAKVDLSGGIIECKIWEESATIDVIVNSGKMVYPRDGKDIVKLAGVCIPIKFFLYLIVLVEQSLSYSVICFQGLFYYIKDPFYVVTSIFAVFFSFYEERYCSSISNNIFFVLIEI